MTTYLIKVNLYGDITGSYAFIVQEYELHRATLRVKKEMNEKVEDDGIDLEAGHLTIVSVEEVNGEIDFGGRTIILI